MESKGIKKIKVGGTSPRYFLINVPIAVILNARPLFPTHIFTAMEAEGKLSLKRDARKRSSIEPQEPRANQ